MAKKEPKGKKSKDVEAPKVKKSKNDEITRVNFRNTEIVNPAATRTKINEIVNLHSWSKDWDEIRLIGDLLCVQMLWIEILPEKGDSVIQVPRAVPDLEDHPYSDIPNKVREQVAYYNNAILRDKKEKKSKHKPTDKEKEAGHLIVSEKSKSPVVVVRFPAGAAKRVREISLLGDHDISDDEHGVNLHVRVDKNAPPAMMYSVQKGEPTPLTEKEKKYLLWPLEKMYPVPSAKEMKQDAKQLASLCPPEKEEKAPF